jgi:hypothetical protein
VVAAAALMLLASGVGADKKDKTEKAGEVVDSGSFGVFVAGKRVATEKFQIEKRQDGNVARSELTVDDGNQKASQTSELRLASNGDLQRYSWKEQSPGKAETTVEPKETFLIEYITPSPGEKAQEVPYFVPRATAILDDNFFTHRELLAWRYMGTGCRLGLGQTACRPPKMTFGVIIPRQGAFLTVSMEYLGKEKVKLAGGERELNRFNLASDGMDWALWLDDQHKLVRILIVADNTEVLRD